MLRQYECQLCQMKVSLFNKCVMFVIIELFKGKINGFQFQFMQMSLENVVKSLSGDDDN